MKKVVLEKLIEDLQIDVYPITILKYLLNKQRVLHYFVKASDPEFKIRGKELKVDHSDCEACESKKNEGVLCRQHTSIHRVLNANKVLRDSDTNVYFFKNEIFKQVEGKLVVVYCPHTKLIKGDITDEKVRKINPITIEDSTIVLPKYETVDFKSTELLSVITKCWFNDEFSIISVPENNTSANFALQPNN